ncbi:RNA-binding protein 23/39 [Entomortierella parvispora]|uniref:RNA-binding protein 23/39 n=1 Tax=Entomortierella parvispora TaxID=205924 RepID=A0A9P3H321_9FUNG|nr:RNA-binding protein 23/39 [Entomortierella parvispora]
MDYEAIEAMVDAPFQKENQPGPGSMDMDVSRRNSKSSERVPSVGPSGDAPRSRSPGDQARPYSRERNYSRDRDGDRHESRRHRRSRSRSPRRSREHRDYGDYHRDHRDRDYRDHRDRDYRDYRDSRGHRDQRRGYSRERGSRRSRSPRAYGGGHSNRRRRSPSPPADDTTCDRRTVFVMQLSARLRSSELEEFFSQAGKVRAARVIEDRNTGRSKGVGYVEFYDEESVAKAIALTGQKILGIPVIAKHTESEKNRLALQAASQSQSSTAPVQSAPVDMSQHRLYVGSLNFDMTEEELQRELEKVGPLEFVKLHRDADTGKSKGFAFVQYKDLETAKKAMVDLNGQVLAGRTIKVGLVTEKGSNGQSNNNYQYNNSLINNSISIDDSDTAGYTLTSQSRADLMQKLARGDVNLGAVPTPAADSVPAPAASTFIPPRLPVVMPSRSVLLKNMFTDEDKTEPEWAKELEEDVKEEAEKNGPVVHIHVEQDSPGEIYLKFDSVQSATNAVQTLGGRFFAGRQIIAAFLPEMLYNVRFPRAANV